MEAPQVITLTDIESAVRVMAETAIENERYFSELDAVVGDADFGVSLATGFRAVLDQWSTLDRGSIGAFLIKVSAIITSTVGGCSGPIWGTAFMRAGLKSKGRQTISLGDLVVMLRSAIEGIQARGGAQPGDKTLLDALVPVADRLEEMSRHDEQDMHGALEAVAAVASGAVEATRNWEAKRGRQSFTGERSIGTLDPGIVAVATILQMMKARFAAQHP